MVGRSLSIVISNMVAFRRGDTGDEKKWNTSNKVKNNYHSHKDYRDGSSSNLNKQKNKEPFWHKGVTRDDEYSKCNVDF